MTCGKCKWAYKGDGVMTFECDYYCVNPLSNKCSDSVLVTDTCDKYEQNIER